VLATVERGAAHRLDQLEETIADLVESVLRPAAPASG
jgi:hypothetical protein